MTNYILVFFITLSGLFGVLSYQFYGDKAEAESALVQAINVNSDMQKSLNLQTLSCKQDDKDTVDLEADKKALKDGVDDLTTQISKLKSGIKVSVKAAPVSPNTNNPEAPKNAEANTILDGTELLSDDLVRMLTESYCLVETCTSVSP